MILSIAAISDTEAIAIIGSSGSVKAYKLNNDGSATQIGSTYTTAFTYMPVSDSGDIEAARTEHQELFHNFASMVVVNSNGNHTYFKATASSFTNFTISNPLTPKILNSTEAVSVCSLDADRVMFGFCNTSGADNDGFNKVWAVDFSNSSLIYYKDTGDYGFDPGLFGISKWSDEMVLIYGFDAGTSKLLSIV